MPPASPRPDAEPTPAGPRERITLLAAALAGGIALGAATTGAWPWLAAGGGILAGALLARRRGVVALALIAAATACLGASWYEVRCRRLPAGDLAALAGDEPRLVRIGGVVVEPPTLRDRRAGSMALFDHRPPATYFAVRARTLAARGVGDLPVGGEVLVRVQETVTPFRAGDRVELLGMLYPPKPPRNPGELDFRRRARSTGRAGLLDVPRRELVSVTPAGPRPASLWLRGRAALRRRAAAWLLSDLPDAAGTRRETLLAALLLGRRGPDLDGLGETFRRAGLSHFLAISGLHLGVLAGFVLLCARLGGGHRRWHGALVIAVVAGYLVLVEVRMPVLRAGIMTIAACLGLAAGRRLRVGGLVAASAAALLLWRPDELFSPGFQLSYGVVLGLIHLAPLVRARWFGRPDVFAPSSAVMLGQWLRTACAVAVTAWAVATPISLHHWGVAWPLAAPFSVLVLPLVAVVLAAGYVKMLLGALLPSGAVLLAVPLAFATDVLASLVETLDDVPLARVDVGHPPAAWSCAALGWVCVWATLGGRVFGFWGRRPGRWVVRGSGLALLACLAAPLLPRPGGPALRLDTLAVGDGSCHVLRSAGRTIVFDAGSASDLDAGRRVVVPALRRLGVRSIDALLVSHANLDHYSAVPEIVEAMPVGEILVTPHFADAARRDPAGPAMHLLETLGGRRVPVAFVAAGERRAWGRAWWTWLHPDPRADYERVNDASMVILVEAAGRTVLLCGDVQRAGLATLPAGLRADVVELPHHGAWHEKAGDFVSALRPAVVLQSTGVARWRRTNDRWAPLLPRARRLVTARDGACRVEIEAGGGIATSTFRRLP